MAEFAWNSRKLLRVLFESQASFRVNRVSKKDVHLKEETVASKLLDLSAGGCALESPCFLPTGAKLNIFLNRHLLLNKGEAKGKVVYTKIVGVVRTCRQIPNHKYRLGVQFDKISSDDIKLIRELVATHERREEPRIIFPKK